MEKFGLYTKTLMTRNSLKTCFFPIKILGINQVWAPGGLQKTKVIVSGKKTPRFPIDVDKVVAISHDLRKIDLVVEFERK